MEANASGLKPGTEPKYRDTNQMKKLLLRWVLLAISVAGASAISQALGLGFKLNFASGSLSRDVGQLLILLVGVAILSFLNATMGRLLKLLTLPLSCITLGLTSLAINAIVLWLAASFHFGFTITKGGLNGFIAAFVASIIISFINGVLGIFLPDNPDEK